MQDRINSAVIDADNDLPVDDGFSITEGLRKRYRALRAHIAHHYIYDRVPMDRTLFLAGAGRSGTTWLAEVIQQADKVRYMFEPFHADRVEEWRGQSLHQYMPVDAVDAEVARRTASIVGGKIRNIWPDHFNTAIFPRYRLVKDIRTNLMLAWIHKQFPIMKIALIVRHPCAVIHSRRSLKWEVDMSIYFNQPKLMNEHLYPFAELMATMKSPLEQHICRWCIEHYVPFRQLQKSDVPVMFYEDFCDDATGNFTKLFNTFGLPYKPGQFEKATTKPSKLSRADSSVCKQKDLTTGWRKHYNESDMQTIKRVMTAFGLDQLYNEQGKPDHSVLNRLLGL